MIWWRQLIGKTRYFIVAYTYQLDSTNSGHGQLTSKVSGGGYISVDKMIEAVEPYQDGKIETFLINNIIEINKKDFNFYQENNTILEKNEKLEVGETEEG